MLYLARKTSQNLVARGALALLLGIIVLAWPNATLKVVAILFGIWLLVDGLISLAAAFGPALPTQVRTFAGLAAGISIIAGLIGLIKPWTAVSAFAILIGLWLLISGATQIGVAVDVRKVIEHEWVLLASGILTLTAGIVVLAWPSKSLLVMVTVLGWFILLWGALQIGAGLVLRSRVQDVEAVSGEVALLHGNRR